MWYNGGKIEYRLQTQQFSVCVQYVYKTATHVTQLITRFEKCLQFHLCGASQNTSLWQDPIPLAQTEASSRVTELSPWGEQLEDRETRDMFAENSPEPEQRGTKPASRQPRQAAVEGARLLFSVAGVSTCTVPLDRQQKRRTPEGTAYAQPGVQVHGILNWSNQVFEVKWRWSTSVNNWQREWMKTITLQAVKPVKKMRAKTLHGAEAGCRV